MIVNRKTPSRLLTLTLSVAVLNVARAGQPVPGIDDLFHTQSSFTPIPPTAQSYDPRTVAPSYFPGVPVATMAPMAPSFAPVPMDPYAAQARQIASQVYPQNVSVPQITITGDPGLIRNLLNMFSRFIGGGGGMVGPVMTGLPQVAAPGAQVGLPFDSTSLQSGLQPLPMNSGAPVMAVGQYAAAPDVTGVLQAAPGSSTVSGPAAALRPLDFTNMLALSAAGAPVSFQQEQQILAGAPPESVLTPQQLQLLQANQVPPVLASGELVPAAQTLPPANAATNLPVSQPTGQAPVPTPLSSKASPQGLNGPLPVSSNGVPGEGLVTAPTGTPTAPLDSAAATRLSQAGVPLSQDQTAALDAGYPAAQILSPDQQMVLNTSSTPASPSSIPNPSGIVTTNPYPTVGATTSMNSPASPVANNTSFKSQTASSLPYTVASPASLVTAPQYTSAAAPVPTLASPTSSYTAATPSPTSSYTAATPSPTSSYAAATPSGSSAPPLSTPTPLAAVATAPTPQSTLAPRATSTQPAASKSTVDPLGPSTPVAPASTFATSNPPDPRLDELETVQATAASQAAAVSSPVAPSGVVESTNPVAEPVTNPASILPSSSADNTGSATDTAATHTVAADTIATGAIATGATATGAIATGATATGATAIDTTATDTTAATAIAPAASDSSATDSAAASPPEPSADASADPSSLVASNATADDGASGGDAADVTAADTGVSGPAASDASSPSPTATDPGATVTADVGVSGASDAASAADATPDGVTGDEASDDDASPTDGPDATVDAVPAAGAPVAASSSAAGDVAGVVEGVASDPGAVPTAATTVGVGTGLDGSSNPLASGASSGRYVHVAEPVGYVDPATLDITMPGPDGSLVSGYTLAEGEPGYMTMVGPNGGTAGHVRVWTAPDGVRRGYVLDPRTGQLSHVIDFSGPHEGLIRRIPGIPPYFGRIPVQSTLAASSSAGPSLMATPKGSDVSVSIGFAPTAPAQIPSFNPKGGPASPPAPAPPSWMRGEMGDDMGLRNSLVNARITIHIQGPSRPTYGNLMHRKSQIAAGRPFHGWLGRKPQYRQPVLSIQSRGMQGRTPTFRLYSNGDLETGRGRIVARVSVDGVVSGRYGQYVAHFW